MTPEEMDFHSVTNPIPGDEILAGVGKMARLYKAAVILPGVLKKADKVEDTADALKKAKSVVKSGQKGSIAEWLSKKGVSFPWEKARQMRQNHGVKAESRGLPDNFNELSKPNKQQEAAHVMVDKLKSLSRAGVDVSQDFNNVQKTRKIKSLLRQGKYEEVRKITSPKEWDDILKQWKR